MMLKSTLAKWCAVVSSSAEACSPSAEATRAVNSAVPRAMSASTRSAIFWSFAAQPIEQRADLAVILVDVGDEAPLPLLAGRPVPALRRQIGAALRP